jgi:UDP-MurNAc hydroxylase
MKFSILSHAGLLAEHRGVSVVCDPWLIGSCYWRSWWNFPEPAPQLIANLAPKYVYLTHLHWDHFHGPSLQKLFDPKTTILVPKVTTQRMVEDLRWLGFHNIVEIPHGGRVPLGDDFQLRSYQFGLGVDSAALLSGGGYTLFNCNDCKFFGLPLRQILRDFPKIDFLFRSHSSASPVPLCIEDHENLLPANDASYDSADQFARCALYTRARYAIPFASNHCFLHEETRRYNSTATTPDLAKRRYEQLAKEADAGGECVVMPPGSSWSDREGFEIVPFDFERREAYVELLLERNSAKLAEQATKEAAAVADLPAFRDYFESFIGALPGLARKRLEPVVFRVKDSGGAHDWLVDPGRRVIEVVAAPPPGAVIFEVHAVVLNDCARLRMFSVWTASKRIKIHLPSAASLRDANLWFTLLDLYEVDVLPLHKNFSPRSLGVRLRRWREPVEVAAIVLRRMFLKQRFSVSRIYPLEKARG